MKNTRTLSCKINKELLNCLDNYAQTNAIPHQNILEEALKKYKEHTIKQAMKNDFARADHSKQEELSE